MTSVVRLNKLGFHVELEDGTPMPQMTPGNLMVFHARFRAEQYARALDTEDAVVAAEIIVDHGRLYAYEV